MRNHDNLFYKKSWHFPDNKEKVCAGNHNRLSSEGKRTIKTTFCYNCTRLKATKILLNLQKRFIMFSCMCN